VVRWRLPCCKNAGSERLATRARQVIAAASDQVVESGDNDVIMVLSREILGRSLIPGSMSHHTGVEKYCSRTLRKSFGSVAVGSEECGEVLFGGEAFTVEKSIAIDLVC
jgi:hypothetical protein